MTTTEQDLDAFRLQDCVWPRRYTLRLAPDLATASFEGEELVEIEVTREVSTIELNAVELEIDQASLALGWDSAARDSERAGLEIRLDTDHEKAILVPPRPLAPGRYTLSVAFRGILNDKLCGFYRSRFTAADGVERSIATTQFEETDARRAFPCFDEPEKKAVFAVSLDVDEDLLAISNSREISVEPLEAGRHRVRFADTVVMSTYLVAFVVGPLEATASLDVDGVALRVVYAPGKAALTGPALECGAHALRFFAEYFSIPYPGDKLDLVAIPDFAAGAMENLGCVTFREAILLADPDNTARTEMQRLAEVVEHEIAHMWFGDLVTMRWWNGIWLNEAFATFMALCCQDDYRPDWECFVAFSRGKATALAVDGLHATRPIEYPVRHPDEAAAMFDVLTYEKGASVLWMLQRYLGAEAFRAGVRRYLAAHQYANTETTDLWDAIEAEAGDEPIRAVMDSWIFQGGYPLLRATLLAGDEVSLTQTPFSYLPRDSSIVSDSAIGVDWLVPVIARPLDGSGDEVRVLVSGKETRLARRGPALVVNVEGAGFYRLSYDDALLYALLDHLEALAPGERYNLVADTWAVALSGRTSLEEFFTVVDRLADERDPHVWSVVIGALGLIDLVAPERDRRHVARLVAHTLTPQLERVGWQGAPDEDEQTPLLRSGLISALGTIAGDEAVIERARAMFHADHERSETTPADLVSAVLGVVAADATRAEFDAIVARYRKPLSPLDEVRHLNCLAQLTDVALASEVHELCRSEIRSQNAPYLLGAMLRNRAIGRATWEFITSHYDELVRRFPDNSLHRMLDGVSGLAQLAGDGTPLLREEIRAFCDAHVTDARRRHVDQSLERLEVNVGFARSLRDSLAAMLGTP